MLIHQAFQQELVVTKYQGKGGNKEQEKSHSTGHTTIQMSAQASFRALWPWAVEVQVWPCVLLSISKDVVRRWTMDQGSASS